MKYILIFLVSLNLQANETQFSISTDVYNNENINFISHHGSGRFGTYLTMEVNYHPVKKLFDEFVKKNHLKLITRGEAHITVITPIEFYDVLKSKLSMSEIDQLAKSYEIQKSKFKIKCIGSGSRLIDSVREKTFYLVVSSPELLELRNQIAKRFISKGGDASLFDPNHYFPHITLGFTKRDLHESDGVIKNLKSCTFPIEVLD